MTRFTVSALLVTVLAAMWDIWWHGSIGRDSFWELPHIFLYTAILVSIGAGIYGWYKTREVVWKRVALALLAILISAPIDEFWHRTFGTESPLSPLIVWSPPHVILILAVAGSMAMLLPLVRREKDIIVRWLMNGALLAGILTLLLFLVLPLQPLGLHRIMGFYGAGAVTLLITCILLLAQRTHQGPLKASMVGVFFLLYSAILIGENLDIQIVQGIPEHPHPPFWIDILAVLMPALVIDSIERMPLWIKGTVFGFLYSAILYTVSNAFIEVSFQYSFENMLIAIGSSLVGGFVAGLIISRHD